MQSDFLAQKGEKERIITVSFTHDQSHNIILTYPKFHYELNQIEHLWCHSKGYARHFCEYNLEKLHIVSVTNSTILGNYNCCRRKMAVYQAGIKYGSIKWRSKTFQQKTCSKEEERERERDLLFASFIQKIEILFAFSGVQPDGRSGSPDSTKVCT